MYRNNEGQDVEKCELRSRLQAAEEEIRYLKAVRRENGFWTKQRHLSFTQEFSLFVLSVLMLLGLLGLLLVGKVIEEEAYQRRNAIVYSVNYLRSSRVNVRCAGSSCQGRNTQGHYVILHCDSVRCWRVW